MPHAVSLSMHWQPTGLQKIKTMLFLGLLYFSNKVTRGFSTSHIYFFTTPL